MTVTTYLSYINLCIVSARRISYASTLCKLWGSNAASHRVARQQSCSQPGRNINEPLASIKCGEFLEQLSDY
jgi:hypothetical protein